MGELTKIQVVIPYSNEKRTVRVYLPNTYNQSKDCYPVLYMHDGQNVFTDDTATYGRSWRVKDTLEQLEKEGFSGCIVVAMDNSERFRYDEYSPWQCEKAKSNFHENQIYGGNGAIYAHFLTNELRPLIERSYRVKKGPEYTYLCGSSMGGFISAYMAAKYPDVYGKIGVFSIASWFAEGQFLDYMNYIKIDSKQKIFIQTGTNETSDKNNMMMSQLYINNALNYYSKLIERGMDVHNITFNLTVNDEHCEASWSKHMKEFFKFLL